MGATDYGSLTPDGRLQVVSSLLASWSGVLAELCSALRAVDDAGDWRDDGSTSMAEWVAQVGWVRPSTAQDLVRTAGRLGELPALAEALAQGRLSWDQIRPAARLATPDTDARLADDLVGVSVPQIELLARTRRPEPAPPDTSAAWLRRAPDRGGRGVFYRGFLPSAEAALLDTALDGLAERAGADPATGIWSPLENRLGDALAELAAGLHADGTARATVIVHAGAEVVDDGDGAGSIGLSILDPDGVNRLLCDAEVTYHLHDGAGHTIGIGRAGRVGPSWLGQRVTGRDLLCRFAGCHRRIRQLHHIEHWSNGGPTDSGNLVGLCWTHHRLVHEGGWTVTGDADAELEFSGPRGRRLVSRVRPEWRPPRRAPAVTRRVALHLARRAA